MDGATQPKSCDGFLHFGLFRLAILSKLGTVETVCYRPMVPSIHVKVEFDPKFPHLKEQCVGFRGIYWQKWSIISIIMFSLVYNHLKLRIVVFALA